MGRSCRWWPAPRSRLTDRGLGAGAGEQVDARRTPRQAAIRAPARRGEVKRGREAPEPERICEETAGAHWPEPAIQPSIRTRGGVLRLCLEPQPSMQSIRPASAWLRGVRVPRLARGRTLADLP